MPRTCIFGLMIAAAATLIAGCEPGVQHQGAPAKPVAAADPDLMSCCQEPTPSLADLRADAAKTAADGAKAGAGKPSPAAEPDGKFGVAPIDQRDQLNLGFTFTDQDGKPFDLKTIKGKPTVATFIFTRCPNAQMCPRQVAKIAALQSSLAKAGDGDNVNLLLFTFDPDYDTPARLKAFGEANGVKFTNARMLRPEPRDLLDFKDEFQFRAFPTSTGELTHKTDLFLIDKQGRLAAFYGGMWDDDVVEREVAKLMQEQQDEKQ